MKNQEDICFRLIQGTVAKSKEIEQQRMQEALDFNVFKMLEVHDKEVIMCRMLCGLIDPHGSHGMGSQFLKIFCKKVLSHLDANDNFTDEELDYIGTNVFKEYLIPDSDRRIDLVIETKNRFIPIEVKIYAGEQQSQVYDYIKYTHQRMQLTKYLPQKTWKLIYLTLDGHAPSDYSTRGVYQDEIINISWKEDIREFLQECLKLSMPEQVSQIIKQYLNAVNSISGNTDEEFRSAMRKMLMTEENMKAADLIAGSIYDVKTAFLRRIFTDLQSKLNQAEYAYDKPLICHLFDIDSQITNFYKMQGPKYPGINLLLKLITWAGEQYYLGIRFEIEWRPYVGVMVARYCNGKCESFDAWKECPELMNKMMSLMNLERDGSQTAWWINWYYVPNGGQNTDCTDAPNFKIPGDDNYYRLYGNDYYNVFIDSVVNAMLDYYNHADWNVLRQLFVE